MENNEAMKKTNIPPALRPGIQRRGWLAGLALAAILALVPPSLAGAQAFGVSEGESDGGSEEGSSIVTRSSVANSFVLGQPMPFSVVRSAQESTKTASIVEHPNTDTFALTLERIDGDVEERPIYEAVYDGSGAAAYGPDGMLEFLETEAEMLPLAAGESASLDLDMKEIFGFELIDPGLYRLSIAAAEGEAPFDVVTFSIVFDPVPTTAYLIRLKEKGTYIERTWAERMLAEHP